MGIWLAEATDDDAVRCSLWKSPVVLVKEEASISPRAVGDSEVDKRPTSINTHGDCQVARRGSDQTGTSPGGSPQPCWCLNDCPQGDSITVMLHE